MSEVNFKNRTLYHGDNLEFLRGLNSGTVHLIATDPPFNKGRDFHATPDSLSRGASFQDRWSWRDDVHDEWLDSIQEDYDEVWRVIDASRRSYGNDLAAFLCFMAVRLIEMHRVLRDDGSIYLHCDPTASHYLKVLMDAIFGSANYRSEITYQRATSTQKGSQYASRRWGNNADILLYYSASRKTVLDPRRALTPEEIDKKFNKTDENGERYYDDSAHIWSSPNMGARPNLCYEWHGFTNPHPSGWRLSKQRLEEEYQKGNIVIREGGKLERRKYLKDYRGATYGNVWTDIPPALGKERIGYPTQKPLALYERIIKASSNPGDIVLDPFSGCATTPIAAERLGRQWVGMDLWDKAHKVVLQRLESEGLAVPEGDGSNLITFGDVYYCTEAPKRTDNGNSIQMLDTPTGRRELRYPKPRTQHGRLLADVGARCQGCGNDYSFDPRVLEVDHKMPRADGGTDAYENLTLLCPPCNKLKRDRLTLTGLQAENRRLGYMNTEGEKFIAHGEARRRARRRRR